MFEQSAKPTLTERMIRASRLDPTLYEEVERDKSLMGQAMMVVVLVAIATGIGAIGAVGAADSVRVVVSVLIGWALLAWLTYFIGTRLFPEPQTHANWGELARTLGFAYSPGVLRIFGVIPGIGPLFFLVAGIWQFIATIVAVRHALDYKSTWRAAGVLLIGSILSNVILGLFLF